MIGRREFITLVGGAVAGWPFEAHAGSAQAPAPRLSDNRNEGRAHALGVGLSDAPARSWLRRGAEYRYTPPQIIDKLNKEINAGLANPKFKAQLASLGGTALPGLPADFGKLIADETEKWGKVVKSMGIKAD